MRIVHVFKTYMPETNGGIEQVIEDLSEQHLVLGHSVKVLATVTNSKVRRYRWRNHAVKVFPNIMTIASTPLSLSFLLNFIKETKKADIIHYHFPWPLMDLCQIFLRPNKKFIVTYHSDIIKQKKLKLVYKIVMKRFFRQASAIVVTSPQYLETSRDLEEHLTKTSIIPLGIKCPLEKQNNLMQQEKFDLSIAPKQPYILFLGVLRYYKGLKNLIECSRAINAEIIIAGTGPEEVTLKKQAKNLGAKNVQFLGRVTEEEKEYLLQNATLFVFPSNERTEAFGISLLEASAYELPMVTCEIGTGTSYVNIDKITGFVVAPNNPTELANAVNIILSDDQLRERLGKNARKRFEDNFQSKLMADRYAQLYEQIIYGGE